MVDELIHKIRGMAYAVQLFRYTGPLFHRTVFIDYRIKT